jgi:hypothetical protein
MLRLNTIVEGQYKSKTVRLVVIIFKSKSITRNYKCTYVYVHIDQANFGQILGSWFQLEVEVGRA